jgi:hypothetical protein
MLVYTLTFCKENLINHQTFVTYSLRKRQEALKLASWEWWKMKISGSLGATDKRVSIPAL